MKKPLNPSILTILILLLLPAMVFAAEPKPAVDIANRILELFTGNFAIACVAIAIGAVGFSWLKGFLEMGRALTVVAGATLIFGCQLFARWMM